jgi:DNA polymerase alpha subunit A
MDDGHDDWASQEDNRVESDEEDTKKRKKCGFCVTVTEWVVLTLHYVAKKKAIDDTKAKPKAPPPPAPAPSISAYRPQVSAEQEDEFMSSILDTMKTLPPPATKSRKRKSSPPSDGLYPGAHTYRRSYDDTSSDGPMDDPFDLPLPPSDDLAFTPRKKVRTRVTRGMTPDTERMSRLEVQSADEGDTPLDMLLDDVDMDAFMKVEEQDLAIALEKLPPKKPPVPSYASHAALSKKEESAVPSWLSVYDSLSVTTQDTLGPLAASSAAKVSATNISALEADGSLRFFWMDYLEHNDNIFFVGKLKDKNSGAWVSCCVTVEGLQRNLFILPRDKRVEPEDGDLVETDIVPEKADVYQDFDRVRSKFGIKKFKAKFVKRKYAFGERDVPREERDWLKVVYGFDGVFCFPLGWPCCSRRDDN